ncbi:CaiB/BaiF CoA transferase family protein [Caproiciproducens sp. NJN-50]|uniref:CaiB/BaiF CoA transferase family protein n=1 Tax=Caproiciproducens sp. NJN-50 TaxID=2507162 RepID=UPI0013E8CE66|nr:CoA transferase [Caproiciproducens sp. NJN-50]
MRRVFEGIRVLDFSNNLAGPCCAAIFADLGAEVIKIERPFVGDDSRAIAPRIEGQSLQYIWFNRGKKSVELALDDPEAQEMARSLIRDADILVESFKPGNMKRFGLDYENVVQINPKLIYCSISACGQTGAYAKKPGFDIIAQGMSGLMDLAGEPDGAPVKQGVTIGDYVGSFNAYGAIVTALYYRNLTGEGQYIDISLLDGLVSCNSTLENAATLDAYPTRSGRHHQTMAPYGIYLGKNGQSVVIAAYTPSMWKRLCTAMERPDLIDDPRFCSVLLRAQNIRELVPEIEGWLSRFDRIDDAISRMEGNGVACCKIKSTHEVANDPVLWERGSLVEIPTQPSFRNVKSIRARGPWMQFSKTPMEMKRAPDLGEHSAEVFARYGWNEEKVHVLKEKWKIAAECKKNPK